MLTHPGGSFPGDLACLRYRSQIEPRIIDLPGSVCSHSVCTTAARKYYTTADSRPSLIERKHRQGSTPAIRRLADPITLRYFLAALNVGVRI